MTDCSQLSDFEINKRVAQLHGGFALTLAVHDEPPSGKSFDPGRFDPCNNPADAWPIIAKHGISIEFDGDQSTEPPTIWCHVQSIDRKCGADYQKNPLRAAMIVFLMMQEK